MSGKLSLVATPIGNLEDISLRALRTFKEVDYIFSEDTRVIKKLLDRYEINKPLRAYNPHNDFKKNELKTLLLAGNHIALCSDAGTPGVSDPGAEVVKSLSDNDILIESIPGASALITVWSLAGITGDSFLFLGFLPHKKGRQTILKEIKDSKYPVIIYESKHRILKLLEEMSVMVIEKNLIIGRELTKMYEKIYRGQAKEILNILRNNPIEQKGEFVVIIDKK